MRSKKRPRRIPASKRRELEIAAAVAREAVMQTHLAKSLKLIELAGDRVSANRMLAIYARLHSLSPQETEVLANRVLASLGQRARRGHYLTVFVEGEEENPRDSRSLLRTVRDRLRGRTHHDLRHWVELHTGSTQVALLDIHVRHSLRFVQELAATHGIGEALMWYRDLVGVDDAQAEMLYMLVLDRLAREELPRAKPSEPIVEQLPLLSTARARVKRDRPNVSGL